MMLIMMLKFCVKESSNLIGLESFGAIGFFFTAGMGWCSPHQPQSDEISTHQSPPPSSTKFLNSPEFFIIIT